MKIFIDPEVETCIDCGLIKMINIPCQTCELVKGHKDQCRFFRAATSYVAIECEHGYDACPICDKCNCAEL